jgi:hypothetical protein
VPNLRKLLFNLSYKVWLCKLVKVHLFRKLFLLKSWIDVPDFFVVKNYKHWLLKYFDTYFDTKICYLRQFQAAIFDPSRCKISMGQILQKKLFNANRFIFSYNYLKGKLLWKIWRLSNFLPELGARFLQRQPLKLTVSKFE